jgi:pSer/pThr/pTyr-binding forkhead associated (FHA) protein
MNADTTTIRLSIKRGKTTEEVLDLSGPDIPIGRNPDARVSFDDDGNQGVSWDHATIRLDQTGVFVADAGSTNGTYLNGTKVEKQVPLHEHDIIRLGAQGPEIQILKISVPPAAAWRPSDRQSPSTAGPAKPARQVAATAAVSATAREDKPSKAPKDKKRKSESTPDVRFGDYVVRHFGQTKGAFAFGICLAILAAPILSLFKARLHVVGVWAALGLLAAFCFACGFAYLAGRWLSFYLLRRRSVGEHARSLAAKAFYMTAIATILLFPIPIIESFSSEQGMLVTLVPQLADFQSKPGAPPDPVPPEPDPPPPEPVPPEPEPKPTQPELVPPAPEPKPSPPEPVPPEPEPKPTPPELVPPAPEPKPSVSTQTLANARASAGAVQWRC